MDDRKLAEFNYNIINNILINKAYLSKWISETNAMCSICNQKEDTTHLLYDCSFNDHIWQIVGNCLQFNTIQTCCLRIFFKNKKCRR